MSKSTRRKKSKGKQLSPEELLQHINSRGVSEKSETEQKIYRRLNIVFTIVTVIATAIMAYFGWQSYAKSLPSAKLDSWFPDYETNTNNQVTAIVITATVSNVGGQTFSLIGFEPEIIYEPVNNSTPSIQRGLDLTGGLQILLVPDIITDTTVISTTSRVVIELPGIKNSEQAIELIRRTGLLELGRGEESKPPNPPICIGDKCSFIDKDRPPDVFLYPNQPNQMPEVKDFPIPIASGESRIISLKWLIKPFASSTQVKQMNLVLKFNDGSSIVIPVLDKFKPTPSK